MGLRVAEREREGRERDTDRQTERQTETDSVTERQREKIIQRDTERERDRETETETERDRERGREQASCVSDYWPRLAQLSVIAISLSQTSQHLASKAKSGLMLKMCCSSFFDCSELVLVEKI